MDDPKKPLVLSAEEDSTHAPDEALAIVAAYWNARRVTPEQATSATVTARPGSRVALRLMGVLTSFGRRRLPMVVTAHATPHNVGSTVTLTMTSNEGYYPMGRMRIADAAYSNRFDEMRQELRLLLNS